MYSWDNAQVVLVGNKMDLEDDRLVSLEKGRRLADQLGLEFFETSAKENVNVKQVFERLVDIICDKMAETGENEAQQSNTQPGTSNVGAKGGGQSIGGTKLTNPANANPSTDSCQC
jgi:Ras-related protein Rab-3C